MPEQWRFQRPAPEEKDIETLTEFQRLNQVFRERNEVRKFAVTDKPDSADYRDSQPFKSVRVRKKADPENLVIIDDIQSPGAKAAQPRFQAAVLDPDIITFAVKARFHRSRVFGFHVHPDPASIPVGSLDLIKWLNRFGPSTHCLPIRLSYLRLPAKQAHDQLPALFVASREPFAKAFLQPIVSMINVDHRPGHRAPKIARLALNFILISHCIE